MLTLFKKLLAVCVAAAACTVGSSSYGWELKESKDQHDYGTWSPLVSYDSDGWASIANATYTGNSPSDGSLVTLKTVMRFCGEGSAAADGHAVVRMAEVENRPMLQVRSGGEWILAGAEGLVPQYDTEYTVEFAIDYASGRYSVKVGGKSLTTYESGASSFVLNGTPAMLQSVLYGGTAAFKSLEGSQSADNRTAWLGGSSENWDDAGNWVGDNRNEPYFLENAMRGSRTVMFDSAQTIEGVVHVAGGTASSPLVFKAANADCGLSNGGKVFRVGENGDAVVRFENGKWNFGTMYVAMTEGLTAAVTNLNADLSLATLTIASGKNSTGTFTQEDGLLSAANTLFVGYAEGANASFYNRGGALTVGGYGICISGNNRCTGRSYFELSGGAVTNKGGQSNLAIGDRGSLGSYAEFKMTGGEYYAANGNIIVGGRTRGVVTMDGGRLAAANGTIAFNGGTLKAYADNQTLIKSNDKLSVTATALGGAIDAAGYAITIAEDIVDASGETGKMTYKGGGSVTLSNVPSYTGGSTIELGTLLVLPSAVAGSSLTVTVPAETAEGVYEVAAISGAGVFADGTGSAITCADGNAHFVLSRDKQRIYCLYGAIDPAAHIYLGPADGDLSTAANWLSGSIPTSGNAYISCGSAAMLTAGATFRPETITIPESSAVVTITDDLYVTGSLTNAWKLAVASGATLTVDGDLVAYAANNTKPLLYSNEGTVTVGGKVRFSSNSMVRMAVSTVCQYEVVTANTSPIIAGGLAYDAPKQQDGNWYPDYLVANLGSMDNGAGEWVVGADGFTFPHSRTIGHSGFRATGSQSVTLHSSADWTLDESYRHMGNDLYIADTAKVTIDTADWADGTTPRTVTLKGFVNVTSAHATPLTVTGCGTVVFDTAAGDGDDTNKVNSVLAVTNGATLQVNAGKTIAGTGTISLAAGTTLALQSTASTFTEADILPVTLPETGKATIKIDGERLRSGVDFTICSLSDIPEGYVLKDHLNVAGTVLGGRQCELKAVEVTENETTVTKLVLKINPIGLVLMVR